LRYSKERERGNNEVNRKEINGKPWLFIGYNKDIITAATMDRFRFPIVNMKSWMEKVNLSLIIVIQMKGFYKWN